MQQFVLFWSSGSTTTSKGLNLLDACWNSGAKPEDFKKLTAYKEGDSGVVQFSL